MCLRSWCSDKMKVSDCGAMWFLNEQSNHGITFISFLLLQSKHKHVFLFPQQLMVSSYHGTTCCLDQKRRMETRPSASQVRQMPAASRSKAKLATTVARARCHDRVQFSNLIAQDSVKLVNYALLYVLHYEESTPLMKTASFYELL